MRKVYEGETLSQALLKIKIDLGKDAIIVEHKKIKKGGILGFFGKIVYQVVAIKPTAQGQRSENRQSAADKPENKKTNLPLHPKTSAQPQKPQPAAAVANAKPQNDIDSKNKLLDMISQNTGKPKPGELNMILDEEALPDFDGSQSQSKEDFKQSKRQYTAQPQQNMKALNPYIQNKGNFVNRQPQTGVSAAGGAYAKIAPVDYNLQLNNEIQLLKNELKNISLSMAKIIEKTDLKQSESIKYPGKLSEIYIRLIENEIDETIADKLIQQAKNELKTEEELDNITLVEKIIEKNIINLFPKVEQLDFNNFSKPLIMTLAGPTGVGKTTTIAKLGANFSLIYGRKIGFLTIDTYRLAAVEQLEKYAEILDAPLKVIFKPEDIDDCLKEFKDRDIILVDTAGRSPNDQEQMNELKRFVDYLDARFEVYLVIQATTKYSDIEEAIKKFSKIRFDKVIITKIDETITFGSLVNIAHNYKLKINYITTGQDVPDDIEHFDAAKLAAAIIHSKLIK